MRAIAYAVLIGALVWAQGLKYLSDMDAAFQQAKKTKKPLWVMVSATWCGPCRWTEKEVFPRKWFDSLITPHFIPLKVYDASGEANTPKGEELASKYGVRAYPTFLFLYPNGEVFYRAEGAPMGKDGDDPQVRQEWHERIQKALLYKEELPSLRQKFAKGDRTPELVRHYFQWALRCGDSATLGKAWEAYLTVFPSPRLAWLYEPQAYQHLREAALRLPAAETYALNIADTLRKDLPYKTWKEIYKPLIEKRLFQYAQRESFVTKPQGPSSPVLHVAKNTVAYARTLQERFPFAEAMALEMFTEMLYNSRDTAHSAAHRAAAFNYALQYVATVKSIEPPDPDERSEIANSLNSIAWSVYEHADEPAALWAAVSWTKDALSYEPDAWHIWDTLGALYYKLKRKKEAIEALSKAISLAKVQNASKDEYQPTQELLEKAQALD